MSEPDDDESCPNRVDDSHCDHWWDGEACCACGAPVMTPTIDDMPRPTVVQAYGGQA